MSEKNTPVPVVAVTPYKAAAIVNEALKEAGLTKVIPPQMMYNYTKARINAGKPPFIKYDEKTGVDVADLDRWTTEYVRKQLVKAGKAPEATEAVETEAESTNS